MPLPTFGIWRRKKPEVLDHQYALLDGFQGEVREFYVAIEQELQAREVPGLTITREEFAEGGLLSAKREYLRMRRERLVFDVCSAPFGKGWFYSYRFAEIPACLMLWELLVVFVIFWIGAGIYFQILGFWLGLFSMVVAFITIGAALQHSEWKGVAELDDTLMRIPVIGSVYEALLRPETYYRVDTRLMYVTVVREIVEGKIREATAAKGITQVEFKDATPSLPNKLAALLKQTARSS